MFRTTVAGVDTPGHPKLREREVANHQPTRVSRLLFPPQSRLIPARGSIVVLYQLSYHFCLPRIHHRLTLFIYSIPTPQPYQT
jgi:hypothetical protein